MKGWSTKYALTHGIYTAEVEQPDMDKPYVYEKNSSYRNQYILGKTFFWTEEEALGNARLQATKAHLLCSKRLGELSRLIAEPKRRV